MRLKVCFNSETHKISNVPETFESLNQLISKIFLNKLPEAWNLEYIDSEGDKIRLGNEQDFKEFVNSDLKNTGNSVMKVFIVPKQSFDEPQVLSKSALEEDDEYQVIDGSSKDEGVMNSSIQLEKVKSEEGLAVEPAQENAQKQENRAAAEENEENIVLEKQPTPEIIQENQTEQVPETQEQPKNDPQSENQTDLIKPVEPESTEVQQNLQAGPNKQNLPAKGKNQKKVAPKKATAPKKTAVPKPKKFLQPPVTHINVDEGILEQLLNKAVEKNLAKIASMTKPFLSNGQTNTQVSNQTQNQPKRVVHAGVRCDGCRAYPIVGNRYKCSVLPDFDFCETCEKTKEHPYAFIVIKHRGQLYSHNPKAVGPLGAYNQVKIAPSAGSALPVQAKDGDNGFQADKLNNKCNKPVEDGVDVKKEETGQKARTEPVKVVEKPKEEPEMEGEGEQVTIQDETELRFGKRF